MSSEATDRRREAEEIAFECLARMEVEGPSVLDEVCANHPEHASAIRAALEQLEGLGMLQQELPAAEVVAGQRLGEFRLLRKLGGGGMGIVYLAEQVSLHRKVALKLIRPGLQVSDTVRERFRREIDAISKLDDPGICMVYEAGELEGAPYLAMRYIEGEALAQVIERRRRATPTGSGCSRSRDIATTLEWIECVARALHVAHEQGLVHRDIKPANIMLDGSGRPVILDFGLARIEGVEMTGLTMSGELLGTPAYMSPEQVTGQHGKIDRRTDVYSLGVTLFECLTLRCPYESKGREELYHQILTADTPDPRRFSRSIGQDLRVVLQKALEKKPEDRFATALQFAEELHRVRCFEPIVTRSPGPARRMLRWMQRNRPATAILATVSVALLFSLLVLRSRALSERRFRALALVTKADEVRVESPELAFKLLRVALELHDDPVIVQRIQTELFRMSIVQVIDGFRGGLQRASWSPDGRYLVVVGPSDPPRIYSAQGVCLADLQLPAQAHPWAIAFSPDNQELAVGCADGRVYVHDLAHLDAPYRVIGRMVSKTRPVTSLAFGGLDGQLLLVSHGEDRKLGVVEACLWTRDGELRSVLRGERRGSCTFLRNGNLVAVGRLWNSKGTKVLVDLGEDQAWHVTLAEDRFLLLQPEGWSLWTNDGRVVNKSGSKDAREGISWAEFSPDGTRFVVSRKSGKCEIFDGYGKLLDAWRSRDETSFLRIRFSPDGQQICGASWGGAIEIWDLQGRLVTTLSGHIGGIKWVEYQPPIPGQPRRIVSAGWDGTVRVWTLGRRSDVPVHDGFKWPDVAVSPDGRFMVVASEPDLILYEDGKRRRSLRLGNGLPAYVGFVDDRTLLAFSLDRKFTLWDVLSATNPKVLEVPLRKRKNQSFVHVLGCDSLGDGKVVIAAGDKQSTRLYLWEPTYEPKLLGKVPEGVLWTDVSADGNRVLTSHRDGKLMIWDREFRKGLPLSLRGPMQHATFSTDGTLVIAGDSRGAVAVWDASTGQQLHALVGNMGPVITTALSGDNRLAAAGATDSSILAWDLETGKTLLNVRGFRKGGTRRVAFTGDGRRLATAGNDGSVRLWYLFAKELRLYIKTIDIPPLTPAERARFGSLLDG